MSMTTFRPPQRPFGVSQPWFPTSLGVASGIPGNTVSGTYYNGKTYFAFCDGDGKARVAQFNHSTRAWTISPVIVSGALQVDTHCGPSVLVRSSDHKIVLAVAPHDLAHLYIAVSTNAEDITAWGSSTDIHSTLGGTSYTYANLFQLSGESGKIHLFYRDYVSGTSTGSLGHSTSTDGGATWAAQDVIYSVSGKASYWAISSDDTARIDIVTTDGSAGDGNVASVYHFYYTGGSYYKSAGTLITAGLPLGVASITKIYDSATSGSARALYDTLTNGGNPVSVWASYNVAGSGSPSNYWYASCSSGVWTVNVIDSTGSVPDVFAEGGVAIDATAPTRVFVSKKTSSVWQMFTYDTADAGATWTAVQKTTDSLLRPTDAYNLRPRSPRNAVSTLSGVWFFGPHFSIPGGVGLEPPAAQIRGYPNG